MHAGPEILRVRPCLFLAIQLDSSIELLRGACKISTLEAHQSKILSCRSELRVECDRSLNSSKAS